MINRKLKDSTSWYTLPVNSFRTSQFSLEIMQFNISLHSEMKQRYKWAIWVKKQIIESIYRVKCILNFWLKVATFGR